MCKQLGVPRREGAFMIDGNLESLTGLRRSHDIFTLSNELNQPHSRHISPSTVLKDQMRNRVEKNQGTVECWLVVVRRSEIRSPLLQGDERPFPPLDQDLFDSWSAVERASLTKRDIAFEMVTYRGRELLSDM